MRQKSRTKGCRSEPPGAFDFTRSGSRCAWLPSDPIRGRTTAARPSRVADDHALGDGLLVERDAGEDPFVLPQRAVHQPGDEDIGNGFHEIGVEPDEIGSCLAGSRYSRSRTGVAERSHQLTNPGGGRAADKPILPLVDGGSVQQTHSLLVSQGDVDIPSHVAAVADLRGTATVTDAAPSLTTQGGVVASPWTGPGRIANFSVVRRVPVSDAFARTSTISLGATDSGQGVGGAGGDVGHPGRLGVCGRLGGVGE